MAEPLLKKGSIGEAVRQLQWALEELGYDPGEVDGIFGAKTESAVQAFQRDRGLDVDGIVGEITWLTIDEADTSNPTIRKGSTGNPVRRCQKRLTLAGYDTGASTASLEQTPSRAAQVLPARPGLTEDGIVGTMTRERIDALGD